MRVSHSNKAAVLAGLFVITAIAGCGGGSVSRPSAFPVTGKVTGASGALEGVTIVFNPNDASTNSSATGILKADGSFELETSDGRIGAEVGFYKVTLAVGAEAVKKAMESMMASGQMNGPPSASAPFPEEYLTVETTPKTVEVKPEINQISIEL